MKQWFCHVDGKQYGPVDEAELRQWISQGRVKQDSLIWSEGMAEWIPASTLDMQGVSAATAGPATNEARVTAPALAGSGGQRPNAEIMATAREMLEGRWGLAIGFVVILWGCSMVISSLPFIGGLASMLISGALQLSSAVFFLTLVRRGNVSLDMLLIGFKNFGNALATYLLMNIFILLWMLLLIIPGIIASLAYAQSFFILAENPNMGPIEAIRCSKEMMIGHKWKLFCLGLRFIGWILLCILTLGIGFIFLTPYMVSSLALFYDDVRDSVN